MKKNRRKTLGQRPGRRRATTFSMESLEDRHVLAANVIATVTDSISADAPTDDIMMNVSTGSASDVTLIVQMTATDGDLNPAAPEIRTTAGVVVSPISSMSNAIGTDGMTIVRLPSGDYSVAASAESGTGRYQVDVAILGDVASDDSRVTSIENMQASAALLQATGQINHVTSLLFQQQGIDLSVSQYDVGFDANMNGRVDGPEVGMVEANMNAGVTTVTLESDVDGPVISNFALQNDTGTSDTDAISTEVAVVADVQDDNLVTSISASLDGAASVDITSDLGDLNGGSVTVTRAILDSLAGGALTAGTHTIALTGTDEFGNVTSAPETFSFTLIENNMAPTASGTMSANATEDVIFLFNLNNTFTDPDAGDVLTFSVTGGPDWLSVDGERLSGTPENDDVGTEIVSVTATDSQGLTAVTSFTITITNLNDSPVVSPIADQTVEDDAPFSLDLNNSVNDVDAGDTLTVSVDGFEGFDASGNPILSALPGWLSFDTTTLILSGTPTDADVGPAFDVIVQAVDAAGLSDSTTFSITVQNLNDPPTLQMPIPDDTATEGQAYTLNLADFFSDEDMGDSLTFDIQASAGTVPSWLNLNETTGVVSGTPNEPDVGLTVDLEVTATDTFNESASDTFTLTVENVNDAPVVNDASFNVNPTSPAGTVVGTIDFSDEDIGDTLTLSVTGAGSDFDVNLTTGEITIAAGASLVDGEMVTLMATVTDAAGASDTATITIDISANADPTANDDSGFTVNDIEVLTIMASDLVSNDSDPDGDTLTISDVSGTSTNGATVIIANGNVEYNPRLATTLLALEPGDSLTDTFTYTVSDGNGGTATATVSVTVTGTDSVEFTLQTLDLSGNEITTINPGDEFDLVVFTQDIRPDAQGVFAPFLDVTYDAALVSVADGATIVHSPTYNTVPVGDISTPGLIDEVGALDGFSPLGGGVFEVFRLRMQAGSTPGVVSFESNPADDEVQNAVLVFLDDDPVPNEQINFGSTSLTIAGPIPPLSAGTITNFENPLDTNANGVVSPQDILVVVNAMASGVNSMYPDVNADGVVSGMDAVAIINHMYAPTPQAPMSGSVSATDAAFEMLVDDQTAIASSQASQRSQLGLPSGAAIDATPNAPLDAYVVESDSQISVADEEERAPSIVDSIFEDYA